MVGPRRAMLARQRLVHDDVARPFQVVKQALGGDPRHRIIRVMFDLPAIEP